MPLSTRTDQDDWEYNETLGYYQHKPSGLYYLNPDAAPATIDGRSKWATDEYAPDPSAPIEYSFGSGGGGQSLDDWVSRGKAFPVPEDAETIYSYSKDGGEGTGTVFTNAERSAISADFRTRGWQGIAKVGAVVGGAAAFGAIAGGAGAGGAGAGAGLSEITLPASIAPYGTTTAAAMGTGAAGAAGATTAATVGAKTIGPAVAGGGKGGLLAKSGGFLSRNKDIIGSVVSGLGDAYSADAAADAQLDVLRERDALTDANYRGANPSRTYRGLMPGRSTHTPQERFGPSSQVSQNRGFMYKYDARVGQIVRVPVEPVQQ